MRRVFVLTIIVCQSMVGCKEDCSNCTHILTGAESIVGEWEWNFSIRASESAQHSTVVKDTMTPISTGIEVTVIIDESGCMEYLIGEDCYWVCIHGISHSVFENSWICRSTFSAELDGPELDIWTGFTTVGPNCSMLDTMIGAQIPYNEKLQYLPLPELQSGYEESYYANYFVRKQ